MHYLTLLDHIKEVLLLCRLERLKLLHSVDVHLVLCLWLWRLKRTGEDCNIGIMKDLGHLGVTHVLVDHNAIDQCGVLKLSANFPIDLVTQVDIAASV